MQNNINNNERDAFSEIFRKKLENHRIPVDADSWDAIQARMKATKRKKIIPLWWWYSGGAAVAVVILLFTLLPFSNQSPEHPIAKQLIIHKTVILKGHATIAENNSSTRKKATSNNFSKASVTNSNQKTVSIDVTEIRKNLQIKLKLLWFKKNLSPESRLPDLLNLKKPGRINRTRINRTRNRLFMLTRKIRIGLILLKRRKKRLGINCRNRIGKRLFGEE